jgi:DNA polymerase-1
MPCVSPRTYGPERPTEESPDMKRLSHRVAGDECPIFFPEHDADLAGFRDFLTRNATAWLAVDTETTGLHVYGDAFRVRLVQFGSASEAWVLQADRFGGEIREALAHPGRNWVMHNAPYDLLALDRVGLASFEALGPRVADTYILGHLADPRTEAEGGTGLGLKPLSTIYVDPEAADTQKDLYAVFRKTYKATKETGWALIDVDHPLYVTYAGLDVIYTSRLMRELGALIKGAGLSKLAHFEMRVQLITTAMQRRGMRVDVDYARKLVEDLAAEEERHKAAAAVYGVENVNSTRQVTEALLGMGEEWNTKTSTGNLSAWRTSTTSGRATAAATRTPWLTRWCVPSAPASGAPPTLSRSSPTATPTTVSTRPSRASRRGRPACRCPIQRSNSSRPETGRSAARSSRTPECPS